MEKRIEKKNGKKQGLMKLVTVRGHTLGGQQRTSLYYWSEIYIVKQN